MDASGAEQGGHRGVLRRTRSSMLNQHDHEQALPTRDCAADCFRNRNSGHKSGVETETKVA
jgi:hypothetical protein